MTPTGTNLLGLVKHLCSAELPYLGFAFGRNFDAPPAWFGQCVEPNRDKWATAEESRDYIVEMYRRAWAHSDATIEELNLDVMG